VRRIYYASPGQVVFQGIKDVLEKVESILAVISKIPELIIEIIARF